MNHRPGRLKFGSSRDDHQRGQVDGADHHSIEQVQRKGSIQAVLDRDHVAGCAATLASWSLRVVSGISRSCSGQRRILVVRWLPINSAMSVTSRGRFIEVGLIELRFAVTPRLESRDLFELRNGHF